MNHSVNLQLGRSHVLATTKCANALIAIEELIWNALDADATIVNVTLQRNSLDTISSISVDDNGEGIPFEKWNVAFGQLGDSQKISQRTTTSGRSVHGKSGKGRLKSLGVGSLVKWESRYIGSNGQPHKFTITADRSTIREFKATPSEEADPGTRTGVNATITNLDKGISKLDDKEAAANELSQKFCLYLTQYPGVSISFEGILLDPERNKSRESTYPLSVEIGEETVEAELTVVEWKQSSERAVYLCDSSGFARDEHRTRIKKGSGWKFTAYLRSKFVDDLERDGKLGLSAMDENAVAFLNAGHEAIERHFRERETSRAQELVDTWKSEDIYPYPNRPDGPIETAEQKVFDIFATNISAHIKDFETSSKTNKKLTFRLLRETLAQDPTQLGRILREVVSLPQAKQDELASMLDRAKLAEIISASHQVIGRLQFLDSLDDMIYGELSKKINEPRQLHRILSREMWIFGEQYNLGADEKGLRNVLKAHMKILGRKEMVTEDVKLLDGKDARFDLMLWTQVPTMHSHVEHLVIEFKRPTVTIDADEITQIQKYAIKVANDSRFDKSETSWRFILIGKEMSQYAEEMCLSDDRAYGHIKSGNPSIFLTTWANLIREARYRYEFFKKELAIEFSDEDGLKYLREKHGEFFNDDWSAPKKKNKPRKKQSSKARS
ncbi:ATP-binding protein [Rhodopirellula sp. JC740]|uniref:ATP-binding protein n=1 Tax=Rhodopirellula halodulae TaxID=2894198 RepID=A0ABS8NLG5_9BACT|nr:ATP-binding protein [Rhodopirellula sp. JC740]MCC9644403.1 ATP-binding protein [Rhodopirellula sp. JC740]